MSTISSSIRAVVTFGSHRSASLASRYKSIIVWGPHEDVDKVAEVRGSHAQRLIVEGAVERDIDDLVVRVINVEFIAHPLLES